MLNRSGESGHPCLAPDFRGNAFNFSPLRVMLAVGLSYIALIMLRYTAVRAEKEIQIGKEEVKLSRLQMT